MARSAILAVIGWNGQGPQACLEGSEGELGLLDGHDDVLGDEGVGDRAGARGVERPDVHDADSLQRVEHSLRVAVGPARVHRADEQQSWLLGVRESLDDSRREGIEFLEPLEDHHEVALPSGAEDAVGGSVHDLPTAHRRDVVALGQSMQWQLRPHLEQCARVVESERSPPLVAVGA